MSLLVHTSFQVHGLDSLQDQLGELVQMACRPNRLRCCEPVRQLGSSLFYQIIEFNKTRRNARILNYTPELIPSQLSRNVSYLAIASLSENASSRCLELSMVLAVVLSFSLLCSIADASLVQLYGKTVQTLVVDSREPNQRA